MRTESLAAESPVHPSIPQGERILKTGSAGISIHGEVSNHERKGNEGLFAEPSMAKAQC